MRAMILRSPGRPLELVELPEHNPGPGEIRIRVSACGVCRTDLHVVDGELDAAALPLKSSDDGVHPNIAGYAQMWRPLEQSLVALRAAIP